MGVAYAIMAVRVNIADLFLSITCYESDHEMSYQYPASHDTSLLSEHALALKIARHSQCSICDDCSGFHPPRDVTVIADDEDGQSALDRLIGIASDEDGSSHNYLQVCECGHDCKAHGADVEVLGKEEYRRRGRVAIRLDELLLVSY